MSEPPRHRPDRARAILERDDALLRLQGARVWAAAGAVVASLGFAGLAYAFAPGHSSSPGSASSAAAPAQSGAATASASNGSAGQGVQAPAAPPQSIQPSAGSGPAVVSGGS